MKPELNITMSSPADLPDTARAVIEFAAGRKIILFEGDMGSGKTTLIKEMARQLGSSDHFSSPTYSIVNEYAYPGGKIFHFDLYRLRDTAELLDIGIDEYLSSSNYCLIEWPALAENLVEGPYSKIVIRADGERRIVTCTNH